MDKRGQMGGGRKIISIVLGIIFLVLGLAPLLKWNIPALPQFILWLLAVIGGIVLFVDASKEYMSIGFGRFVMYLSLLFGALVLAFGLIPILGAMGMTTYSLPALGQTVVDILFIIGGGLLVIGGFYGF